MAVNSFMGNRNRHAAAGAEDSMRLAEQVYAVVRQIPQGRVATYGQIALLVGRPKAARAVGTLLARNPHGAAVPCHRVLNAKGALSRCAFAAEQRQLLWLEGVPVVNGRVDLACYQWNGNLCQEGHYEV